MANKRRFKKDLAFIGASICDEMMINYYNTEGFDDAKCQQAVVKVLETVSAAIKNSNVFFDRGRKAFANPQEYSRAKKAFFKTLFAKIDEDVNNGIQEGLKLYNEAVPEELKKENKAAVAE